MHFRYDGVVATMITPQQFVERFLQEKTAVFTDANLRLAALFENYFGGPMSQRINDHLLADRQVVEKVTETDSTALVYTCAEFSKVLRRRFRLLRSGAS